MEILAKQDESAARADGKYFIPKEGRLLAQLDAPAYKRANERLAETARRIVPAELNLLFRKAQSQMDSDDPAVRQEAVEKYGEGALQIAQQLGNGDTAKALRTQAETYAFQLNAMNNDKSALEAELQNDRTRLLRLKQQRDDLNVAAAEGQGDIFVNGINELREEIENTPADEDISGKIRLLDSQMARLPDVIDSTARRLVKKSAPGDKSVNALADLILAAGAVRNKSAAMEQATAAYGKALVWKAPLKARPQEFGEANADYISRERKDAEIWASKELGKIARTPEGKAIVAAVGTQAEATARAKANVSPAFWGELRALEARLTEAKNQTELRAFYQDFRGDFAERHDLPLTEAQRILSSTGALYGVDNKKGADSDPVEAALKKGVAVSQVVIGGQVTNNAVMNENPAKAALGLQGLFRSAFEAGADGKTKRSGAHEAAVTAMGDAVGLSAAMSELTGEAPVISLEVLADNYSPEFAALAFSKSEPARQKYMRQAERYTGFLMGKGNGEKLSQMGLAMEWDLKDGQIRPQFSAPAITENPDAGRQRQAATNLALALMETLDGDTAPGNPNTIGKWDYADFAQEHPELRGIFLLAGGDVAKDFAAMDGMTMRIRRATTAYGGGRMSDESLPPPLKNALADPQVQIALRQSANRDPILVVGATGDIDGDADYTPAIFPHLAKFTPIYKATAEASKSAPAEATMAAYHTAVRKGRAEIVGVDKNGAVSADDVFSGLLMQVRPDGTTADIVDAAFQRRKMAELRDGYEKGVVKIAVHMRKNGVPLFAFIYPSNNNAAEAKDFGQGTMMIVSSHLQRPFSRTPHMGDEFSP